MTQVFTVGSTCGALTVGDDGVPGTRRRQGQNEDGGALHLKSQMPASWSPEPRSAAQIMNAIERFDQVQARLSERAKVALTQLTASDGSCPAAHSRLANELVALRSNRYAVQPLRLGAPLSPRHAAWSQLQLASLDSDDPSEEGGKPGGPWRAAERVEPEERWLPEGQARVWRLEESIWGSRRKCAESRGFYDTPELMRSVLEADWAVARGGGSLEKLIRKHSAADDGEAVSRAFEALWRHVDALYCLFDMYASLGTASDFTQIQFNAYKQMLDDCGLIDEGSDGIPSTR